MFYELAFKTAHCFFAIFDWSQKPMLTHMEVGPPKDMNTSRKGSLILETGYYIHPKNNGYLTYPTYFLVLTLYLCIFASFTLLGSQLVISLRSLCFRSPFTRFWLRRDSLKTLASITGLNSSPPHREKF